jgi:hypothetical protein
MTPRRIFISYSMADRVAAREVAESLRAHGLCVWMDEFADHVGDRVQDIVREQLDQSDAFVLLISPDTQHSPWARYEMSEVLKRTWSDPTKIVVPVLIGDAEPPGYLRDHHLVRLEPAGSQKFSRALVRDLSTPGAMTGVHRTVEGDKRLERRLVDLEQAAVTIAEAEGDA